MQILLDSNVLLRLVHRPDPDHKAIRESVRLLREAGAVMETGPMNLREFWAVCTRPHTARGGYGFSHALTDRKLRLLMRSIIVVADVASAWESWLRLVREHQVSGVKVHDAMIVASMMARGVTTLLTTNGDDFDRYKAISVIDPRQPQNVRDLLRTARP